jgi:FMN phosphatase YigB (HAD superfamily)
MWNCISRAKIPQIYIFDIDDTLYAPELGYGKLIGIEIQKLMSELDGYSIFTPEEINKIELDLLTKYGTSIAGIAAESKLILNSKVLTYKDFYDKLNYNLQYNNYYSNFRYDPTLYDLLSCLIKNNCKIFCFTNGDRTHAEKILSKLKIYNLLAEQFNKDFIISFDTFNSKDSTQTNPIICKNKSDTLAFNLAFEYICKTLHIKASNKVKNNIIFYDDSYFNINSARKFGFNTVYVCKYSKDKTPIPELLPKHKILYTSAYEYETLTDDYQYCQIPYFINKL